MTLENDGSERRTPRWVVVLLAVAILLALMMIGAYLLYGRELFQRPFLAVAVVIAWLGTLVGISIGGDPG